MQLALLRDRLRSLVQAHFSAARRSGSLIFSSTELTVIRAGNVPFQLRYCPALAQKAEAAERKAAAHAAEGQATPPAMRVDPFDHPPPELLIAEISAAAAAVPGAASHLLVLNKYPVIPNHFILATKDYHDQARLLGPDDLAATLACLRAWEAEDGEPTAEGGRAADDRHADAAGSGLGRRLFAFFNSGRHSGASQSHRHIQFLPVEDMEGRTADKGWRLLVEHDLRESGHAHYLPFVTFSAPLTSQHASSRTALHQTYLQLYHEAVRAARRYNALHATDRVEMDEGRDDDGWSAISYNLALTTSRMIICPRRRECGELVVGPGHRTSSISVNGTLLAGTLMVKTREEWDALRDGDEGSRRLAGLLDAVGIPSDASMRTQRHLPSQTWYILTTIALSTLNRPWELSAVLTHAIAHTAPHSPQRRAIAHRTREALIKSAPLTGFPKAINALHALEAALHPSPPPPPSGTDADDDGIERGPSAAARSRTRAIEHPSSSAAATAVLGRGQALFDTVYGRAARPVMRQMRETSGAPDLAALVRLLYGHVLSNTDTLSALETSWVMIAALVPQDVEPQLKGHLLGALNQGASRDQVNAVRAVVVRVCEAAGMRPWLGEQAPGSRSGSGSGWGWRGEVLALSEEAEG
ncbi:MAG: bifunctional AP-4-A phosphorylase/ADP sulfurylase [Phylliscum demangeonii]|nr:MAG: bifunctional AP-4-A phosphorylase/ADP sulfurylase [Phylliscum demangeonii]